MGSKHLVTGGRTEKLRFLEAGDEGVDVVWGLASLLFFRARSGEDTDICTQTSE